MNYDSLENFELKVELTKPRNGRFGVVYLAKSLYDNELVAIKKCCLESGSQEDFKVLCEELRMTRQLSHPYIQPIIKSFCSGFSAYIVSPFMCYGSCKDTMRNCFNTGFPEVFIALILRDILLALSYMHKQGYIHGSIKASHILINEKKAILACFRETRSFNRHGKALNVLYGLTFLNKRSLNWLAPEILQQNLDGYNENSDLYSLGITSCELANGLSPYKNTQPTFMFTEKVRGNVPVILDQSSFILREALPDTITQAKCASNVQELYKQRVFSDEFHKFTKICLDISPNKRSCAQKLIDHTFFKQCKSTSLLEQSIRFGLDAINYTNIRDVNKNFDHICEVKPNNEVVTWNF